MAPGTGAVRVVLLNDATVGASQPFDASHFTYLTFFVMTNGSPGAGVVTIEEADWGPTDLPYSGTWSPITTFTVTASPGNSATVGYHNPGASYAYVRARISTTVTSTTVDVVLRAT